MVHNSSSDFKDSLLKSRQALLDITDNAIMHYGSMSSGFLDYAEGISTKVIWQENLEGVKSPLEYAEVLLVSWKDTMPPESAQLEELIGEIKSRVDISRESYIEIANYLDDQVSLITIELDTYYKPLVQDMAKLSLNLLKCLCWFPDNHRSIRKKVGADNANSQFVHTFESSFKSKSIQIIDHLFFFFEIFQKNLTETIIENLNVWGREYEIAMSNIVGRFEDQKRSLADQKKHLSQVKQVASQNLKTDLTLSNRSTIVDHIETVQIDMAKAILLLAGETTKAVRFSFEFIEKTLNALVKVFDALNTHSELTLGEETLPLEGESLEESIKDYFNIEGELSSVLFTRREMTIQGQMLFDANIDQAIIDKVIMQNLGGWLDYVAPYMHPLEEYQPLLIQLKSLLSQSGSKNLMLSPEINHFVEMADEDINMASIYKYSARINKTSIPCNGTLMLMSEFLIFFCKSLTSNINLLIPYRCIDDLKQVKNFMGKSNGLTVTTKKGSMDFFLADKTVRDQLLTRLQTSVESLRIITQSQLFQSLCFKEQYLWPNEINEHATKLVPVHLQEKMRGHVWRSIRRINIRYLDIQSPAADIVVDGAGLADVDRALLHGQAFEFDGDEYESFAHMWVVVCGGARHVDTVKRYAMPAFLQCGGAELPVRQESMIAEEKDPQELTLFLSDNAPKLLSFDIELPEVGKVTNKWTVYHSHLDLFEVSILSTCSKRMNDFEGLLVASQGELFESDANSQSVFLRLYWKQGISPFKGASELYGYSFLNLLKLVISEKQKLERGEISRYREPKASLKAPEEVDLLQG